MQPAAGRALAPASLLRAVQPRPAPPLRPPHQPKRCAALPVPPVLVQWSGRASSRLATLPTRSGPSPRSTTTQASEAAAARSGLCRHCTCRHMRQDPHPSQPPSRLLCFSSAAAPAHPPSCPACCACCAGEAFLQAMAQEVKGKAAEGNAQNVANVLWAFATLGEPPRWAGRQATVQHCSAGRSRAGAARSGQSALLPRALRPAVPAACRRGTCTSAPWMPPGAPHAGYNPGGEVLDVLATAVESKLDDFTSQVSVHAFVLCLRLRLCLRTGSALRYLGVHYLCAALHWLCAVALALRPSHRCPPAAARLLAPHTAPAAAPPPVRPPPAPPAEHVQRGPGVCQAGVPAARLVPGGPGARRAGPHQDLLAPGAVQHAVGPVQAGHQGGASAPLGSLPAPTPCWGSLSVLQVQPLRAPTLPPQPAACAPPAPPLHHRCSRAPHTAPHRHCNPPAGGRADGGHRPRGAQPAARVQLSEPGQLGGWRGPSLERGAWEGGGPSARPSLPSPPG